MNKALILSLFAFVVVAISFVRLLAEQEFFRLTAMKRIWGRRLGLAMHFVVNVALPMVVGVVFMAQAVTSFEPAQLRQAKDRLIVDLSQLTNSLDWDQLPANVRYWHWGEFTQI